MRNVIKYLIAFLPLCKIFCQPCYYYDLYPSKNRVNDLSGACIVPLNKPGEFIAIGITESAGNDVTFYVNRIESCGDTLWQRVYNFYPVGGEDPRSAILNSRGNILIQGTVYDTVEGARDDFILELDTNGNTIHYARVDAGLNDMGWDTKQVSDGGFAMGGMYWYTGGLFLTKMDSAGNILWQKDYESNRINQLYSIDLTSNNGFVLGGFYYDAANNYSTNYFLIKTDSLGNQLWSKKYGVNNFNETTGYVITTADGGFLLTGYKVLNPEYNNYRQIRPYVIKTDSAGIIQWQREYNTGFNKPALWEIAREINGGLNYIFVGYENDAAQPDVTPLLSIVKTDRLGNVIWKRSYTYFGGETHNYSEDMTISDNGDIGITGYIIPMGVAPYSEMFVLKTDSCGYLDNANINASFTLTLDTLNKRITCTNQSTNYCTPLWYFGDGDSLYQRNATHTYTSNGTYTVTLIVRAGNSTDTIQKQVVIGPPPITISGIIQTETGIKIPGVKVTLTGSKTDSSITTTDGFYSFEVEQGGSYAITPAKNNDSIASNGVSALDIVLMRRHILGEGALPAPYKIIAAAEPNAEGDTAITTLDIVHTRNLILANTSGFPANRLWQFASSDYIFQNPAHPFPFTKSRIYTNITTNQLNQNFIGIRLGDVNDSWDAGVR